MCSLDVTSNEPTTQGRTGTTEQEVQGQVRSILESRFRLSRDEDRRRYQRHPFPYLVRLIPVADGELEPCGQPIVVVGKQLSEQGLDFYHQQPIPFRRAIASLQTRSGRWLSFLVDLTWCRYTEFGWYDNGGRFLQVVDLEK